MMVYIASPYSDPMPDIVQDRYFKVMHFFSWLVKEPSYQKSFIFSPIMHNHATALRYGLPTDAQFWKQYNFQIITACTHVLILRIPGWDRSIGVRMEIDFCKEAGKTLMQAYWSDDKETYKVGPFV